METITTKVYTFDELSDSAKDKARDWYNTAGLEYDWWESIYEDAKTIGLEITGFGLDRNRHATGKLLHTAYVVADKIMREHGKDCDTYKLAAAYIADYDKAKKMPDEKFDAKLEEIEDEFQRDLLEEYSIMLQRESEHIVSDEAIAEAMEANEYTFTESGKRFG